MTKSSRDVNKAQRLSVLFRAGRSETSIPLDWFQRDPAVTAERHTRHASPFL
ncbi:hypothetical protein B0H12DRAFT_1125499 [Mycena haematopus]|nr:hypothetical protein B0H12DRAFT_1125499 [Mycena haematopus]